MKLIRLITTDTNTIFDNDFNEDIIIEPMSKIALQSFACELDLTKLIINETNNEIIFQIKGTGTSPYQRVCYLSEGEYSTDNFKDLFIDMALQMNKVVKNVVYEIGHEWSVEQLSTKKIEIICLRRAE
jgi:hypothetical protein